MCRAKNPRNVFFRVKGVLSCGTVHVCNTLPSFYKHILIAFILKNTSLFYIKINILRITILCEYHLISRSFHLCWSSVGLEIYFGVLWAQAPPVCFTNWIVHIMSSVLFFFVFSPTWLARTSVSSPSLTRRFDTADQALAPQTPPDSFLWNRESEGGQRTVWCMSTRHPSAHDDHNRSAWYEWLIVDYHDNDKMWCFILFSFVKLSQCFWLIESLLSLPSSTIASLRTYFNARFWEKITPSIY